MYKDSSTFSHWVKKTVKSRKNSLYGMVGNQITSHAQNWFNQFGTARIELGMNSDFSLKNSSFDMLLPLYDSGNNMFFTQLGFRNTNGVNTCNIGSGWRHFNHGWMYGGNLFYDFSEQNQRVGVGVEAWATYIKYSANYYQRFSQWQESQHLKGYNYNEHPANGFDLGILRIKSFL